jgi:hypothetical protein
LTPTGKEPTVTNKQMSLPSFADHCREFININEVENKIKTIMTPSILWQDDRINDTQIQNLFGLEKRSFALNASLSLILHFFELV